MKCKCGCGREVKVGNMFINGHNTNKGSLGKRWKLTEQALKNHNEASIKNGLKIQGKKLEEIMGSKEKANERKRKFKQTMEKKKENGWMNPNRGKKLEEIMGSKEKADKRRRTRIQTMKEKYPTGLHYKLTGQALKNHNEAARESKRIKKILDTRRSQLPYIYKNIHFQSKHEIKCYKFAEPLNVPFHYQYSVNGSSIDFVFFDKNRKPVLFWEPHPSNRWWESTPKNVKIYEKQRRRLLDDNGYKDVPLIVTTDLSEETKNKILGVLK